MSICQVSPFLDDAITNPSHLVRIMRFMNITKKVTITIAGTAMAGVLTFGATAFAAGANGGNSGTGQHPRKEYICAHQTEVADHLAQAKTRIAERIAMLTERRSQAEAAGKTDAVARIDKRLERLNKRLGRVTKRAEQLPAFIEANCA
jgi:hypothetical protein